MNPLDIYKDIIMNHYQEILTAIFLYIFFYSLLASISKPKFKELHLQKVGVWRWSRKIGYLVWIENMNEFMNPHTKFHEFTGYLYRKRSILTPKWIVMWTVLKWAKKGVVTSQTKKVIIDRRSIAAIQQTRIVVDKKCIMWDTKQNVFKLTNDMPSTYSINPEYLERWILSEIDNIDTKSTKAARSSPPVVHTNLTQRSIPLAPEDYKETEKDQVSIDVDKIIKKKGEYKRQIEALTARDSKRPRHLPMRTRNIELDPNETEDEDEDDKTLTRPTPPTPNTDDGVEDEVELNPEEEEEEEDEPMEIKDDDEDNEEEE